MYFLDIYTNKTYISITYYYKSKVLSKLSVEKVQETAIIIAMLN